MKKLVNLVLRNENGNTEIINNKLMKIKQWFMEHILRM